MAYEDTEEERMYADLIIASGKERKISAWEI
jgi:hypothetical protein